MSEEHPDTLTLGNQFHDPVQVTLQDDGTQDVESSSVILAPRSRPEISAARSIPPTALTDRSRLRHKLLDR